LYAATLDLTNALDVLGVASVPGLRGLEDRAGDRRSKAFRTSTGVRPEVEQLERDGHVLG
jgi:hypothetical protein